MTSIRIDGPAGSMSMSPYVLRLAWRMGGYRGPFPGLLAAARATFSGAVRVALVIVAGWLGIAPAAWRPARAPLPVWPEVAVPAGLTHAVACPSTGPPAAVAASGAPVILP